MNGILVDDEPLHEAAFSELAAQFGLSLSSDDYQRHFAGRTDKEGLSDYFAANGIRPDLHDLLRRKGELYLDFAEKGLEAYPGAKQCTQTLTEAGFRLALVSSSTATEVEAVLASLSLTRYFSTRVTAGDVVHGKPNPEPYLLAAERLSVSPADCIVIEDSPAGIESAAGAGMASVAIASTHQKDALQAAAVVLDTIDQVTPQLIHELVT